MNNHDEKVKELVTLNKEDERRMQECYKEMEEIKRRMKERNNKLYRICSHNFVRFDEDFMCTKCSCYRDRYMYQ